MPITKGFRALVDEAMAQVKTYSVAEAKAKLNDPQVQIVDIREHARPTTRARSLDELGHVVVPWDPVENDRDIPVPERRKPQTVTENDLCGDPCELELFALVFAAVAPRVTSRAEV